MRDQYKALLLASFKDAMDVLEEYNEWYADEHDVEGNVPSEAVPPIALSLYRSRVMEARSEASFELPEFDGRMYE